MDTVKGRVGVCVRCRETLQKCGVMVFHSSPLVNPLASPAVYRMVFSEGLAAVSRSNQYINNWNHGKEKGNINQRGARGDRAL